jgi:hypothetical protein
MTNTSTLQVAILNIMLSVKLKAPPSGILF